jgi:hypothetical protein
MPFIDTPTVSVKAVLNILVTRPPCTYLDLAICSALFFPACSLSIPVPRSKGLSEQAGQNHFQP